ncbi:MAG TPA: hypothetical protein VE870_17595, partial [Bacteroidales bacterium]|nr:hypothetical protein [Bacteroidales bacterium]
MRTTKPYFLSIILSVWLTASLAGSNIRDLGIPFLTHYSRQTYHASTQNWCITQDDNNMMWFGNTAVVLWFDGEEWGQVGIPNGSVVRSLCTLSDHTVLAGSFADFGSIERDSSGGFYYKTWLEKVPEKYRNFTDVWRIYEMNNEIFIQTVERVLIFRDGKFFGSLEPEHSFRFSYISNGRFYVEDQNAGLKVLMQDQLILVENGDFFKDKEIWFVNHTRSHLMAGTQKNGIFIFQNGKWMQWNTPVNDVLKKYALYSGVKNGQKGFIFGTVQNGIVFCDELGNISKIINRKKGLQNNTVLSLAIDRENNLWAGLDQGIDYIEINSPFTRITKEDGFGTGYCSFISDHYLYLGTNQGVYYQDLGGNRETDFRLMEGSQGQVWNFATMGNDLYCLHHNGLYRIRGNRFEQVADIQGCWEIVPFPGKKDYYIMGTYNGLWAIHLKNGTPDLWKLEGFDESSRILVFGNNQQLWMSHGYKGIYKIDLDTANLRSILAVQYFGISQGLPSNVNNEVFKVDDKVLFITTQGFYDYDDMTGLMKPYDKWNSELHLNGLVTKVIRDPWNRLDIFAGGRLTTIVMRDDSLVFSDSNTFLPLENSFFEAFENVTFISKDLSIIGTEEGFVLYDRLQQKADAIKLP